MAEAIQLLNATVFLRPYVFVCLAFYLTAASVAIGWQRTVLLTGIAWVVAFSAEYSSTRNGIPFTNFFGWAIVGFVTIALFQQIDRGLAAEPTVDQGVTDPVWRYALLPDSGL